MLDVAWNASGHVDESPNNADSPISVSGSGRLSAADSPVVSPPLVSVYWDCRKMFSVWQDKEGVVS